MKLRSLASSQETTMAKILALACVMFSLTLMMLLTAGPTQAETMLIPCPDKLPDKGITALGDYKIVPRGSHCAGFFINASDVNLDLNDSTISEPAAAGTSGGTGIFVGFQTGKGPIVSKVSIFNGTVVDSNQGIQLVNATDCNVRELKISNNGIAISLSNSNRNTIIDNVISCFFNCTGEAIMFENSHNNNLSRNKVIDNHAGAGGAAIRLRESNRNIIEFNDVLRNTNVGLGLVAAEVSPGVKGSFENTILNNRISNNGGSGIEVGSGSDANTIVGNRVNDNGGPGLAANAGISINSSRNLVAHNRVNRNVQVNAGIAIAAGSRNLVAHNRVNRNVVIFGGISVGAGSVQNLILHNSARNNMPIDLFDNNPKCDENEWDFNTTPTTKVNQDCIH